MELNERQEEILYRIIEEYVDSAMPVSSQLLEKKYNFGVSPATIRSEMHRLEEKGLLFQPHASAGRVPTDRGYRLFVDELLEQSIEDHYTIERKILQEQQDTIKFLQSLCKNISQLSSNLVISYLFNEDVVWHEGWEEIFEEPEFHNQQVITDFAKLLKSFEEKVQNLKMGSEIEIYIGKENPFFKTDDFSIICAKFDFPNEKGIISILGPKRMEYQKNISLINSLATIWKKN